MWDDRGWFPQSLWWHSCAGKVAWDIYPRGSGAADRMPPAVPGSPAAREEARGCDREGAEGCETGRAAFPRLEWGTSYPGCSAGADLASDFAPAPVSAPAAPA